MFCPSCGSEYRPGIVHCASCDVPLSDSARGELPEVYRGGFVPRALRPDDRLMTYCGFLSLDDAREAREALRREGIPSEVAIRDAQDREPDGPVREEYWLRLPARAFEAAAQILGYDESDPGNRADGEDSFACSACGAKVSDEDDACASCGERFQS